MQRQARLEPRPERAEDVEVEGRLGRMPTRGPEEAGKFRERPVEDEVKASMEREALLNKVMCKMKLAEQGDDTVDPLNP